jgi:hypothetical protein
VLDVTVAENVSDTVVENDEEELDYPDGPEEWSCEQDRELETMTDALRFAKRRAMDLVQTIHTTQTRLDGSPKLDHLLAVSTAAGRLAECYFGGEVLINERRYHVLVCELAGVLHEVSSCSGTTYEDLVQVADKVVADAVGALTVHTGEPFLRRVEFMANSVGRVGHHAQLVKICDLLHDGMMFDRMVDDRHPGVQEHVRLFCAEVSVVLESLHAVDKHPQVVTRLNHLRRLHHELDRWLRGRPPREKTRTRLV